ncbi:methyltransferase domain-containing protein [Candidatus Halobeggiatoa sp. HSG11]|nr:methyltransferase domain-containing protein [Candidatus Halobeggiatoa sp. HSG11]
MIQRNIVKAKTFINDSVSRVRGADGPSVNSSNSNNSLPGWMVFAREVFRNPKAMGAACESSPRLAKAIADFIPIDEPNCVVELGGGTGRVTEALLQHGIAPNKLISIELSSAFADFLKHKFPQVRVIKGNALHLTELLGQDSENINTVICGLPFRTLPHMQVRDIVKQIDDIISKNDGIYVQFTYDLSGSAPFLPHHFKRINHKIIWRNIPPARINVYKSER